MLINLLKFEWLYQRKQLALPILSMIMLGYGLLVGGQGHAPSGLNFNSGYQIHFYTGIFTLGAAFIAMFFSISGVIRDKHHGMEEILYSTALPKRQYFLSRFMGVYGFTLLSITPFTIGFMLGSLSPSLDPERVGDFDFFTYLQSWLIFIVPNTFVCTAVVFTVALLTKNRLATYISGIFLYLLYMMSSLVLNSPIIANTPPASEESLVMASLADPFGMAAFFEQIQFWSIYQKNYQSLSFTGFLLWNRVLWSSLLSLVLYIGYRVFSFRKVQRGKKTDKKNTISAGRIGYSYHPVSVVINFNMQWKAWRSLVKLKLQTVFKSLPFWGVMLLWLALIIGEFYGNVIVGGQYNNSSYATTHLLVRLMGRPLELLGLVLILFYAGELVWAKRDYQFSGIVDATPVSNAAFFLANLTTVFMLPLLLLTSGILVAITFQLATSYPVFDWSMYVATYYFYGVPLLFYSLFTLFVQSIIPNKYAGMGLSGLCILMFAFFSVHIGIEHPLLRLGMIPVPNYTAMNGYSAAIKQIHHLSFYWLSVGGVLAVLAFKFSQRGIVTSLKNKWPKVWLGWSIPQQLMLALFTLMLLVSMATVFYHTNIASPYLTSKEQLDLQEAYESQYKQYDSLDRLNHISFNTELDLYPSHNSYHVKGHHLLKNKNENPISQVFINEREKLSKISLEGGRLEAYDSIQGAYLFRFDKPIAPQDTIALEYELTYKPKGYAFNKAIVKNGTFIPIRDFEPMLGYSTGKEILDAFERKKRGLPPLEVTEDAEVHLMQDKQTLGKVNFEAIISTEADQRAITSGNLVRKWTSNGRNYFHYKTPIKVSPFISYFSARYESVITDYQGIQIEQYYHQGHDYNLDCIKTATQEALAYCLQNFGAYPFDHLRIAEIPGHWGFGGTSHPSTISMVEDRLYLVDQRDTTAFDLVSKRTIHEVAHQWWGNSLSPKVVEGAPLFVEGFAKYTEAVVLEKLNGKGSLYQLSETANHQYFSGRSFTSNPESPIYLQDDEFYLAYGKNYTVMMALRDLIGEEAVNTVLKKLADKYRNNAELRLTTLEFMDEVYQVCPKAYHQLVDDWFKRVITYDLSIQQAEVLPLTNGQFQIDFQLNAQRFEMNKSGDQKEITLDEPIRIGIFNTHPRNVRKDQGMLYWEAHKLTNGTTNMRIIVDQKPAYIGIDPYGFRNDENLFDNLKAL
ncbi:M1 family aminopeptidase [Limibacter armeniacum]|uniref:ABC transporter permease/M1 family aminopeptidase n=1 Tax=Limibacter armeniacum TaxID=466084 RepID=UPI002FE6A8F5